MRAMAGGITARSSPSPRGLRSFATPLEYDYSVVFTDVENGGIGQGLTVPGGHQLAWTLAAYDGKWCWFEVIQGNRYGRAKDSFSEHWMEPGKKYTSTVKVRQGR